MVFYAMGANNTLISKKGLWELTFGVDDTTGANFSAQCFWLDKITACQFGALSQTGNTNVTLGDGKNTDCNSTVIPACTVQILDTDNTLLYSTTTYAQASAFKNSALSLTSYCYPQARTDKNDSSQYVYYRATQYSAHYLSNPIKDVVNTRTASDVFKIYNSAAKLKSNVYLNTYNIMGCVPNIPKNTYLISGTTSLSSNLATSCVNCCSVNYKPSWCQPPISVIYSFEIAQTNVNGSISNNWINNPGSTLYNASLVNCSTIPAVFGIFCGPNTDLQKFGAPTASALAQLPVHFNQLDSSVASVHRCFSLSPQGLNSIAAGTFLTNWVNETANLLEHEVNTAFNNLGCVLLYALAHSDDMTTTTGTVGSFPKFLKDVGATTQDAALYKKAVTKYGTDACMSTTPSTPSLNNLIPNQTIKVVPLEEIQKYNSQVAAYYTRVLDFLLNCDGKSWPQWENILKRQEEIKSYISYTSTTDQALHSVQNQLASEACFKDENNYYTKYHYLGTFLYKLLGSNWPYVIPENVVKYYNSSAGQSYEIWQAYRTITR